MIEEVAMLPEAGAPDALYILDLHCWMYRFWATTQGRAAHYFIEFVGKLLRNYEPAHFIVCRDLPGGNFRHALYPAREGSTEGYKAQRPPPDPSLLERIRWAHEMLEDVHGITVYGRVGFEADDLIATLTKQAKDAGMRVVIVGKDKDLMQLVDERCVMWDGKREIYGPREVEAKFGIRADQLRDYLAIIGDGADNVPGIIGAGPSAAKEILHEFGSLDEALECAKYPYDHPLFKRKPKYREMLRTQRAAVLLSQKLVSLAYDAPVKLDIKEYARS